MTHRGLSIIGLDVGGANLKFAVLQANRSVPGLTHDVLEQTDANGAIHYVGSTPFPLWRFPEQLTTVVKNQIDFWPNVPLAVTMTGELADCYANRQQGVAAIVDAITQAAGNRPTSFYGIADRLEKCWLTADQARSQWLDVAAANWHATASLVGMELSTPESSNPFSGYLIDLGSTTTDIVPIRRGRPSAIVKTDFERLNAHELVYVGVSRTPICSLISQFDVGVKKMPIARELFATIADAFRIVGEIPADPSSTDTADGKVASRENSLQRMARIVCNDFLGSMVSSDRLADQLLNEQNLVAMSRQAIGQVESQISEAIRAVIAGNQDLPYHFVLTGQGEWLAERVIQQLNLPNVSLIKWSAQYGEDVSAAAAAYAVARLAYQQKWITSQTDGNGSFHASPAKNPNAAAKRPFRIVKLGGSLLDWEGTPRRIKQWLGQQTSAVNLWVTGGGKLVEEIRRFNQQFGIEQSKAHWICLDLMSINGRLLKSWFPDWRLCKSQTEIADALASGHTTNLIVDFARWLEHWQQLLGNRMKQSRLTESWDVTSDSCAAYLADSLQADELVLLKSCQLNDSSDQVVLAGGGNDNLRNTQIEDLTEQGVIDASFDQFAKKIPVIRLVNLRQQV